MSFSESPVPNPQSTIQYLDTHCHIHDSEFADKSDISADEIIVRAREAGVDRLICVGTSLKSSLEALEFTSSRDNCYFSIALHPHEAENYSEAELMTQMDKLEKIASSKPDKLVAIGECGLDYYYHSDKSVHEKQEKLFRRHLEIAQKANLPVIFHIRDAFDDFFRILDDYEGIRGVVHSFSATSKELEGVLSRGLYVGLNGIMTFTSDQKQLDAAKLVPLERLLLETDAPFLTPKPFRGTMCEPKHVSVTAEFLSKLRGESLDDISKTTSDNAKKLFKL